MSWSNSNTPMAMGVMLCVWGLIIHNELQVGEVGVVGVVGYAVLLGDDDVEYIMTVYCKKKKIN